MSTIEKWHYGCPATETYVTLKGVIQSRSKNLRGLIAYSRKSHITHVETRKDPLNNYRGELKITYANDATGYACFASHSIMIDWIRGRRSMQHALKTHHDGDMGYLTKPGTIAGA